MHVIVFILAGRHAGSFDEHAFQRSTERNEVEIESWGSRQPAEWQIEDDSKNRVYRWRKSPDIPSIDLKTMIDCDHWTISQPIASPRKAKFSVFFDTAWSFVLRILTTLQTLVQQATRREMGGAAQDRMHEDSTRRRLHLSDVPFFLIAVPRISIYGLPRDETHYEGVRDIQSRQSLDALVRKKAGKSFLCERNLGEIPDGFEVNTEIILVPMKNGSEENGPEDLFKSMRFWNSRPKSAVKSAQFDAIYPFNRQAFQKTLTKFPERLLEGNLDNFLAIPGSSIPMDKDSFTNIVYSLRSGLAKSAYTECIVDEPMNETLRALNETFKHSEGGHFMDNFRLGRNLDGCSAETRLVHPVIDYCLLDERNFDGHQWKLQRVISDVWVPHAEHFEKMKSEEASHESKNIST
ncbi:hypothetical protein XU18_4145 [Perkinsela sp. CCAP 1560/4]|nr:hypothetical protein XU18_4145 [Perkinsela sp. CCAP 1560/4]|eukprot:KNH04657.1 hypothetical protein XU18_4145 [Perkinsela sp. CCAP 1560/4]